MAKFNKFTPEAFRENEGKVTNLADAIRTEYYKNTGKTISDIAKLKLGELKRSRAKLTVNTEKEGFQLRLRESDNPAQTGEEIHALRKGAQLTIVSDEVINRPDASGLPTGHSPDGHIFVQVEADIADTKYYDEKVWASGVPPKGKVRGWVSTEYLSAPAVIATPIRVTPKAVPPTKSKPAPSKAPPPPVTTPAPTVKPRKPDLMTPIPDTVRGSTMRPNPDIPPAVIRPIPDVPPPARPTASVPSSASVPAPSPTASVPSSASVPAPSPTASPSGTLPSSGKSIWERLKDWRSWFTLVGIPTDPAPAPEALDITRTSWALSERNETINKAAQAVDSGARATLSTDGKTYIITIIKDTDITKIPITVVKNSDMTFSFLDESDKKLTQKKLKEYIKKQYDKASTGISVDS